MSGALLVAAAALALAAAAPALLRAAGAPLPEADAPGTATPLDLRHQPPEILANPDRLFDPDHEADPDDLPGPVPRQADPLGGGHGQLGLARAALALRDHPDPAGKPIGEVKAGEMVMIMRERGDWALVWGEGEGGVVMGWAKKSGIAVR